MKHPTVESLRYSGSALFDQALLETSRGMNDKTDRIIELLEQILERLPPKKHEESMDEAAFNGEKVAPKSILEPGYEEAVRKRYDEILRSMRETGQTHPEYEAFHALKGDVEFIKMIEAKNDRELGVCGKEEDSQTS